MVLVPDERQSEERPARPVCVPYTMCWLQAHEFNLKHFLPLHTNGFQIPSEQARKWPMEWEGLRDIVRR